MDQKRQDQTAAPAAQPEQKPPKKNRPKKEKRPPSRLRVLLGRVIALVVTVLLVLGAVYLVANRDKLNIDALRRAISYRNADRSQAQQLSFDAAPSGAFAALDGGILVCSQTQLQLITRGGEAAIAQAVTMQQPVISTAGKYAVAYDAGGTSLYLIHNGEIVRDYTPEQRHGILSARVSANGWLTIVEQASGYKAAVTVYDAAFQPVVTENISSAFVTDAILAPDGKTLAVVSIGEDAAGFCSSVALYNVSDGAERARCGLGSDLVLDLDWEDDVLWVAGEYGIYCVQGDTVTYNSADVSQYLQKFSLGGDGFAATFSTKYQSGSAGTLALREADGTEYSAAINEEVLDLSAAGDYVAVLTSNELTIYQRDLTVYAATGNSWGARRVLMRADGSALLVTNESASLYLPD